MALPTLNTDLNVVSKLDDQPNDVGGLTAAQLKAKFDEASGLIKTYINGILLPYLEGDYAAGDIGIQTIALISSATNVQTALAALAQSIADVSQGSVADGSITTAKLAPGCAPSYLTESRASVVLNIWQGTQAQYDALGSHSATTLYFLTES